MKETYDILTYNSCSQKLNVLVHMLLKYQHTRNFNLICGVQSTLCHFRCFPFWEGQKFRGQFFCLNVKLLVHNLLTHSTDLDHFWVCCVKMRSSFGSVKSKREVSQSSFGGCFPLRGTKFCRANFFPKCENTCSYASKKLSCIKFWPILGALCPNTK